MSANNAVVQRALLNVPKVSAARYAQNFIRQAVCELRFPTLYELEAARPPTSFALALRKEYPNQQLLESVNVGIGTPSRANVHTFKSKKDRWTVNLKASSVSLETSKYETFLEFKERLGVVLKAAAPVIDSDFFTRVGLRYINVVPYTRSEISGWVNPSLVGPLADGIYGDVLDHVGRVTGSTECGTFMLQHGVMVEGSNTKPQYSLDFDFSSEDVPFDQTLEMVQKLHDFEFSMFEWSLGPLAKAHLGPTLISRNA